MRFVPPSNFVPNPLTRKKMEDLVYLVNQLDDDLQWPRCEGKEDANRAWLHFEKQLIMNGFV